MDSGATPALRRNANVLAMARVALAWAVAAGLLAWLTRDIEWRELASSLRPAPPAAWAAAVFGMLGSYLLRSLRIHAELGRRHRLTVAQCLEVMLVHNAAVNVLPMRGGEAAYPHLMHRRLGVPLLEAVASLVWMRVQDLLVLALLVLALWPGIPVGIRFVVGAGIVVAMAVGLGLLQRLAAAAGRVQPRFKLLRFAQSSLQALALAPKHGWAGWAYCAASWTLKLVVIGNLLSHLSGLPALTAGAGALGGEFAGVLPIQGPANFGTYEAGIWAGAAVRGSTAQASAAPALAVHVLMLTTALVSGAVAYAYSYRRNG